MLVELVQHHLCNNAALELDHHPNLPVGFIPNIGNPGYGLVGNQMKHLGKQQIFFHLIRDFRNDDLFFPGGCLLNDCPCPHRNTSLSGGVHVPDAGSADDNPCGRKVGTRHVSHKFSQRHLRVIKHCNKHINHLTQIVRRDSRQISDADAGRAVDEEVRQQRGKYRRLSRRFLVVRLKIDSIFVDIHQHIVGDRSEAALRITHRPRRIAVDGSKIPLPINKWIADRKFLCQSHKGIVDGLVSVRVEVLHDLANDGSAFVVGAV